jgi:lipoprotein-releasing system ATP-binding protein
LEDINLVVEPGESVAIMGASGVGKSTLLNIMGSLEPPTEGSVTFRSRNVYRMGQDELCRLRNEEIGFVFQFHHLLPEFNALENAMMPALIARHAAATAAQMAREVLEKVGLGKRLRHRAGELSGGEQQRVAIARALIMKPRMILADEPIGNLDWATGQEVAEVLLKLNKEESVAMVIATHNQKFAAKMLKQMEIAGGHLRS